MSTPLAQLFNEVEKAISILGRMDATDIERFGVKSSLEAAYAGAKAFTPEDFPSIEPKKEMKARSRSTDPSTSYTAARRIELLGKADSQRRACFRQVITRPGSTYAEIAKALGYELVVAGKRLPELRDAGFIKNGQERKCGIRNSLCMTWWPIADMEQYADQVVPLRKTSH